jgi:magnesium chelatase subunit H
MIQAQAATLELAPVEPPWAAGRQPSRAGRAMLELEYTLIPYGLHVVGQAPTAAERVDLLMSFAEASKASPDRAVIERLVAEASRPTTTSDLALLQRLADMDRLMAEDREIDGILRAGRPLPAPGAGGDLLRTPPSCPPAATCTASTPSACPAPMR